MKHPELLFESRIYKKSGIIYALYSQYTSGLPFVTQYNQSGALFFRDRAMYVPSYNHDGTMTQNNQNLIDLFNTYNIPLNKSYVHTQYYSHGVSQVLHNTVYMRCIHSLYSVSRLPL